ncbi:MAG: Uma2 family endonuclease [Bacteroidota bacterium]
MSAALKIDHYTYQEYLDLERKDPEGKRFEFFQGIIKAMAGGTRNHNLIIQNLSFLFRKGLKGKDCFTFTESLKLELIPNEFYVYPDVLITCDPLDKKDQVIQRYPSIIVEVISKSTEKEVRGRKMQAYMALPSLKHYILVSQYEPVVEIFSRNQARWWYQIFTTIEQTLTIPDTQIHLPLSDVFDEVTFIPEVPSPSEGEESKDTTRGNTEP